MKRSPKGQSLAPKHHETRGRRKGASGGASASRPPGESLAATSAAAIASVKLESGQLTHVIYVRCTRAEHERITAKARESEPNKWWKRLTGKWSRKVLLAACGMLALLLLSCGDPGCPASVDAAHVDDDASEERPSADVVASASDAGVASEAAAAGDVDAAPSGLCCLVPGVVPLACDPAAPWTCDTIGTHPGTCADHACTPGLGCTDPSGHGTVVACGGGQ